MAETFNTGMHGSCGSNHHSKLPNLTMSVDADDADDSIEMLKAQYECPCFRILIIGRANAGKTTILEKVCGVGKGTKPTIFDEHGVELNPTFPPKPTLKPRFKLLENMKQVFMKKHIDPSKPSATHLTPSVEVSCMVK
jgi:hypothetical protein